MGWSLKNKTYKKFHKIHTAVGLFISFNFLLLSLTGILLLFKDEFSPSPSKPLGEPWVNSLSAGLTETKAQFPKLYPLAAFQDHKKAHWIQIRLGESAKTPLREARKITYDIREKKIRGEAKKEESGFFPWLLELHRELFLGFFGKMYIGFVGFLYVFLLISGFFIYGRMMKKRSFGDIRNPFKLKLADLHKYLGVTSFGWALIVGFTGTLLAFNSLIIKAFQYSTLNQLISKYENSVNSEVSGSGVLGHAIANVQNQNLEGEISFVSFPGTEFGVPGHFVFLMEKFWLGRQQASQILLSSADSGGLREVVNLPFYLKALILSEPLHFGNYGGLLFKIIWLLFALCSLLVMIMGVATYWSRTRKMKEKTRLSPLKNSVPGKVAYAWPLVFIFTIVAGVVGCLFQEGLYFFTSLLLFCIPLVVLVSKARFRV